MSTRFIFSNLYLLYITFIVIGLVTYFCVLKSLSKNFILHKRSGHFHGMFTSLRKNCLGQCFGSRSARIRIKICLLDSDPHRQMRIWIRIQEVKKPRKYTGSLGEYRTGNIKVGILCNTLCLLVFNGVLMSF